MRAQIWTVCLHPSLSLFIFFLLTFNDIGGNFFYIAERAKREMNPSKLIETEICMKWVVYEQIKSQFQSENDHQRY